MNSQSSFPYRRVVVVGVTGSGKSTLAAQLARTWGAKFIELDALHFEPDWREAPLEVFRARLESEARAERWVAAGNYHRVRDLLWPAAEAIVWLDYPLWLVLGQLTRRTIRRWWTQELLWGTNYEDIRTHLRFWSDGSLYHWLFKTYWRRKREYPRLFAEPAHRHLALHRFSHPRQTARWVDGFGSDGGPIPGRGDG